MAVHIHTIQLPRNITAASLVRLQFLQNIQKPPVHYMSHGEAFVILHLLEQTWTFMNHARNCELKHRKLCWNDWSLNYIVAYTLKKKKSCLWDCNNKQRLKKERKIGSNVSFVRFYELRNTMLKWKWLGLETKRCNNSAQIVGYVMNVSLFSAISHTLSLLSLSVFNLHFALFRLPQSHF